MCNMCEFSCPDNWFESLRSIQTSCRSGKDLRECRIVKVLMPDREGKMGDVIVGYGELESFEEVTGS